MINHFILLVISYFFSAFNVVGQTNIKAAARLIASADSVIIISHVATEENHDKPEGIPFPPGVLTDPKLIIFPSFLAGQDINPTIIVQRSFLLKNDIIALADIIRKPVKRSRIGSVPLCFEPHHAILIYTNGHLSYIDMCFHCSDLVTSPNLKLTNMDFKDGKWDMMKEFFLHHGLTYEIEGVN